MPSQESNQGYAHYRVKKAIGWRHCPKSKQRKSHPLNGIGGDSDQPCQAVFAGFHRSQKFEHCSRLLSIYRRISAEAHSGRNFSKMGQFGPRYPAVLNLYEGLPPVFRAVMFDSPESQPGDSEDEETSRDYLAKSD